MLIATTLGTDSLTGLQRRYNMAREGYNTVTIWLERVVTPLQSVLARMSFANNVIFWAYIEPLDRCLLSPNIIITEKTLFQRCAIIIYLFIYLHAGFFFLSSRSLKSLL